MAKRRAWRRNASGKIVLGKQGVSAAVALRRYRKDHAFAQVGSKQRYHIGLAIPWRPTASRYSCYV
jgi:hypothetical protein